MPSILHFLTINTRHRRCVVYSCPHFVPAFYVHVFDVESVDVAGEETVLRQRASLSLRRIGDMGIEGGVDGEIGKRQKRMCSLDTRYSMKRVGKMVLG